MEAQQDDSAPECDMHASMISLQSVRSSRSSVTLHDAMTQSLYGKPIPYPFVGQAKGYPRRVQLLAGRSSIRWCSHRWSATATRRTRSVCRRREIRRRCASRGWIWWASRCTRLWWRSRSTSRRTRSATRSGAISGAWHRSSEIRRCSSSSGLGICHILEKWNAWRIPKDQELRWSPYQDHWLASRLWDNNVFIHVSLQNASSFWPHLIPQLLFPEFPEICTLEKIGQRTVKLLSLPLQYIYFSWICDHL